MHVSVQLTGIVLIGQVHVLIPEEVRTHLHTSGRSCPHWTSACPYSGGSSYTSPYIWKELFSLDKCMPLF